MIRIDCLNFENKDMLNTDYIKYLSSLMNEKLCNRYHYLYSRTLCHTNYLKIPDFDFIDTKFNGLNLIFFVPILINSKKIQKNVKFGIQAHINMENKMNGSDRLFGL